MHPSPLAPVAWTDLIDTATARIDRITPLRGRVAAVLARIEHMLGRHSDSAARAVPSAGATYPYEILLAAGPGGPIALVDPARRQLLIRADDDFPLDASEYWCLLVGRPWLSMRKYGPRGYLYHLVDSGHAIFNLALLGTDSDVPQRDRRPSQDPPTGQIVGTVLAAGVVTASGAPPVTGWRCTTTVESDLQIGRTAYEEWAVRASPVGPRHPIRFDRVSTVPGDPAQFVTARRSASAFRGAMPAHVLDAVLTAGTHCADAVLAQLGLERPVVRIAGAASGAVAIPAGDLLAALNGQDHLLDADAFVVLGGPRGTGDTVDDGRQALLIALGVLGQALYLAATRHGVAVTGVGGFAPEFWNDLLPRDQQALYLIALGRAGGGGKSDALYPGAHR
ncbi:nitroreductase family protein [Nocardia nova]|uniref:nitroreductase family protein n=1 Tax=Nocardia nova TaxID=37330 RepID=UPI0033C0DC4E